MKARELAELLMMFPNFEVIALCTDESLSRKENGYIGYERFLLNGIADVGTADKEVIIKIDIDRPKSSSRGLTAYAGDISS